MREVEKSDQNDEQILRTLEVENETMLASTPNQHLSGKRLFFAFIGMFTASLLVGLDGTIVVTALPRIVSEFNALEHITSVATAYFLTQGGCILVIGQILKLWSKKYVFLASISVFELGSMICAVSRSIPVLILGRAVVGCGSAGIQISIAAILPEISPLEKRPVLLASFGLTICISAVAGPLLGGAFIDKLSWQWCFWINLPFGAVTIGLVTFLLPSRASSSDRDNRGTWTKLDWIGGVLVLGFCTTLLLPLQWGGSTKPWNSPATSSLFIVSGVLLILFIIWERFKGASAMVPLSILKRPTQFGSALSAFFCYFNFYIVAFYLPLWYQARGHSALRSGLDILPMLAAVTGANAVSGAVVAKTGRYWPFLFGCPFFACIGAGLLYTLKASSPASQSIGFQILFGIGVGGIMPHTLIGVQADYAADEVMIPQATSCVQFALMLGEFVGVAIGGSVFSNQLRKYLSVYSPNLPPDARATVLKSVLAIRLLPVEMQSQVIEAYVQSLNTVFLIGVAAGFLTSLAAIFIKNYNIRQRNTRPALSENKS